MMDRFGRELGLAFQLADDPIGIWGDPERTGKPAGSGLAHRKRSFSARQWAQRQAGERVWAAVAALPSRSLATDLVALAQVVASRDR